jgi:hypothetical protein
VAACKKRLSLSDKAVEDLLLSVTVNIYENGFSVITFMKTNIEGG